jgi:dimethylaniline monooxygenase (N-oxide forming)
MRNEGITADGFISGETIHNYLNDFAKTYDLVQRTRLQHQVERVERDGADGWRLEIKGRDPIKTKKLIYASGATSHPVIPTFRKTNFTAPIIHSSDVGTNLDSLNGIKRATIVGSAKSAYDTVYMLLKAGVQVDWIIRENGSGPLAMMPPSMFGYFHTMDLVANNFMALFGSSIMRTKGLGYQIFNKTVVGRAIARTFWRTLTMIAGSHAGYDNSPNAQKLKPLPVGTGYAHRHRLPSNQK